MIKEEMKNRTPVSQLTDKQIIAEYKNLAKTADGRIRAIEAKMGQDKYRGIENHAYARAKSMVKNIIGLSDGKPRFNRSIKNLSRGQKEAMLGHVRKFIDYDTSSLQKYNDLWKRRTETFNKNNRENKKKLSVEEYKYLWEAEEFNQMIEEYGYRDAFDSVMDALDGSVSIDDAINIAARQKFIDKYMEQISKIEGNVRTYMDKMKNVYPEGFTSEMAKELKDIQNKLANKEIKLSDIAFKPSDVTPDQIKPIK